MLHIQVGGAFTSRHRREALEALHTGQTVALSGRRHSLASAFIDLKRRIPEFELSQMRAPMGDGRTALLVWRKGTTAEQFVYSPRTPIR